MSDQVAIKTWGNSQGIRIPKNILEKLGLHVSDTLQIEVIDDSIVLKKAFKHKTFEERVAEYNGEISICDYDWGLKILCILLRIRNITCDACKLSLLLAHQHCN